MEDALPVWLAKERGAPDLRRRARPIVDALFDRYILPDRVVRELLARPSFPRELLDTAIHMAELRWVQFPEGEERGIVISERAWDIVDPDRDDMETDVALGLRLARAAVDQEPREPEFRWTLAWALFANGLHDEALAESERALELANHYDRDREENQGYLDRLRAMIAELRGAAIENVEPDLGGD